MSRTIHTEGARILDSFQPFQIPANLLLDQPSGNLTHGPMEYYQSRSLGRSTFQSGSHVLSCSFYEVIKIEVSTAAILPTSAIVEDDDDMLQINQDSGQPLLTDSMLLDPPSLEEHTNSSPRSDSNLSSGLDSREERQSSKVTGRAVIFTADKEAPISSLSLSPEHRYYMFPRDAVTECLTSMAPHKLIFSYFPHNKNTTCDCLSALELEEQQSFNTKLEEFAAVCSHSCRLSLTNLSSHQHIATNMMLTEASEELYQSIKQMVFGYEAMCQNMMELMKSHNERVTYYKTKLGMFLERTASLQSQLELDRQMTNRNREAWHDDLDGQKRRTTYSGSYARNDDEPMKAKQSSRKANKEANNVNSNQMKKCLYCGSKTTPMWRRGPQGAGTLCNACGVKWKHGKILNGKDTAPSANTGNKSANAANATTAAAAATTATGKKGARRDTKKRRTTSSSAYSTRHNQKQSNTAKQQQQLEHEYEQDFEYSEEDTLGSSSHSTRAHLSSISREGRFSSSHSPLESSSSSPHHSPAVAKLIDRQPTIEDDKGSIDSIGTFDADSLSVYIGEDAVEAAAVLALLKSS